MGKMSKSKKHYTEEFKLTVLKDKYADNLSIYSAAKKYGIRSSTCICAWEKKYPVDSIFIYLIQSETIYLTVNRLKRIRVRCGQRIRN